MTSTKLLTKIIVFVMLVEILTMSFAVSLLVDTLTIASSGQIVNGTNIIAQSGSASDIQDAVDWIVAHGGIGTVTIPAGTFNFVEEGESIRTVNIPAGINIFGAPTVRDTNGQVLEWKTVIVLPWDAPGSGGETWFKVTGNGNPSVSFRFSDIKLVGYRYFDSSVTNMYTGLSISKVLNFRVDHNCFQDLAGSAIFAGSLPLGSHNNGVISGVIDHNVLNNTYGDPGFMRYDSRTLGYGIGMRRWASDYWDYNINNVIGQYNDYTIFIEDNYFSKWRHVTCSNDGIHYVFRYNIVEDSYGIGEADSHGSYAESSNPYAVGTRAMEVYNNIFRNPDSRWNSNPWAINVRGGSGIIFNNTLIGYYGLLDLNNDFGNYEPYSPQSVVNQTYIWNNNLGGGVIVHYAADSVLNVNYFLRAPNLAQDGIAYTPYLYPHPLAVD